MSSPRVIIVGAGHAGFHVGLFLRMRGFDGSIALVDAQPLLPYQRPPLSKEFLHGKQEIVDTYFRPAAFYAAHDIELITGQLVTAIDRESRRVVFADRVPQEYDHLVLATGSRPRVLDIAGAELDGVLSLAVADDASVLRDRIGAASRVAVIGGGFIGLEAAAMAAAAGKKVTVFEAADRLMARAITPPMSQFFLDLHRAHGVDVWLGAVVSAIGGDRGRAHSVITADGTQVPADVILVGVGALARDELAQASGLATDRGVLVSPSLQTSDEAIFAVGDCARFGSRFDFSGRSDHTASTVRLESVQNATDQAKFVAGYLCAGAKVDTYDAVPWFWTEQFGHKLQIAGLTEGFDRYEEVQVGDGKFSIYCFHGDRMIGCESVNSPVQHVRARKELATALQLPVG